MAEKFNLTKLLSERSKEATMQQDAGTKEAPVAAVEEADEIVMLDIYDLIPSKENFYDTTAELEELKQSIELVGLLQPILVKPDGDKYRITAGHRRRLALLALVEEGKDRFRKVRCIKKQSRSAILDRLALIMANRYRNKTDWERMTEAVKTEELVLQLKEEMDIAGRTRDLLAEIIKTTPSQVGRYKAIYNNLIPELMEEFKKNNIGVSAIYEASGMAQEWQQKAHEIFEEKEDLSINDVQKLKKQEKEAQPEEDEKEPEEEYFEPSPETVNSICYSCQRYAECHEKKATVTECNAYINKVEAEKTDEQRYNEEQAKTDAETRKKLREQQQEEKMANLPSDTQQKEHDIRIAPSRYDEITSGKLTFLLLKKDDFKVNEELELPEYTDGQPTGRKIEIKISYIWQEWSGLDDNYCIIGFVALAAYNA